jgi:hypothetical protein
MTADERLALIRVKIERAKQHFADLEAARDRFIKSNPYSLGKKPDPKPGHEGCNLWFMTRIDPIPTEIAMLVGDAIHNIRSALDHLACQLVFASGNSISDQTSFPIFKGTQINEPSFARKVQGMSQAAQDIRSSEPYKNGKGHTLWVLHELDIADKHHGLLTILFKVNSVSVKFKNESGRGFWTQRLPVPKFAVPDFGEALVVNQPFFTCEDGAEHQSYFAFDIAIDEPNVVERKPVTWAIKFLIDKVDGLIGEFEPLLV